MCLNGRGGALQVINNTIGKDLEEAKKELAPKEKALRQERLRLIKEKMGSEADSLMFSDSGEFIFLLDFFFL